MDQFGPVFMDLVIFLDVLFTIEPMLPERTQVGVYLVISMTIGVLEQMQTWFAFFCLKTRRVCFLICFAAPPKLAMVFHLVRAIALDALRALDLTEHCCMSPLPTSFALRDARVYVGFLNGGNKLFYIKTPVNKTFGLTLALNIPNINLDN